MPNIARCASALARVILLTVAFAMIATTADAVPAISPTGAARMEREKAEAQAKALKKQETLRTECMREHKNTAHCGSDAWRDRDWGAAKAMPQSAPCFKLSVVTAVG